MIHRLIRGRGAGPDLIGEIRISTGRRIHLLRGGDPARPALVLLHGASGNLLDWKASIFDALCADWHVIAFDRPGYGHSEGMPGKPWLIADQIAGMRGVLAGLGCQSYALCGHSYGVAIALDWALRHPGEVTGIVALSGLQADWTGALGLRYRIGRIAPLGWAMGQLAPFYASEQVLAREVAEVFAPQPVPEGFIEDTAIRLALRPSTFALNLMSLGRLYPQIKEFAGRVPSIGIPAEVLHGEEDPIVPYSIGGKALAALIPQSNFQLLPGIGHMPHHVDRASVLAACSRLGARLEAKDTLARTGCINGNVAI